MNINYNHNKLERFIPITFIELEEEVNKLQIIDDDLLLEFSSKLRNYYHKEFHSELLKLKTNYHPFNPDRDTITLKTFSQEDLLLKEKKLLGDIIPLLNSANYEQLTQDTINDAIEETSPYGVDVSVNFEEFDNLHLFFRGSAIREEKQRTPKSLYLKKEIVKTKIYRRLFLFFKQQIDGKDCIYLKLFKDIPQSDLEMLFPNIKVKISLLDKIKLTITGGGGTVAGTATLIGKMAASLDPIALLSALGAFIAIIGRQVTSIFTHRTKYMAKLTKNLYFYNLDNNAGAISHILDMAEDEEVKEVFLAYLFILKNKKPLSKEELDSNIEEFIQHTFNIPMDFEIEDALDKLIKLRLVIHNKNIDKIHAVTITEALTIL
ncbi:DUF3754 domain-containing protein [Arcobacteraceae bacterium]|nr:DUF3754 domain-containing protein [Arcobacteraceae bacterium]